MNDRVTYICELMSERVWTGDTNRKLRAELAATWLVSESTIRNYSAEAGRLIMDGIRESRFEAAELALDTLKTICRQGVISSVPGDASAARAAAADLLKFAGVLQPESDKIQKHVMVGVGLEEIEVLRRSIADNVNDD